jgi:hypothetical protein
MKAFVGLWPVVLAGLLFLSAVGAVSAWVGRSVLQLESARAWVLGLVVSGMVATFLAAGVSDSHVGVLVGWLDSVFPPYRGMRDADKWAAVLALVYSQLSGVGALVVLAWIRGQVKDQSRREWASALVIALLLAAPTYYGNGMLYGMHGQIRVSAYPSGWYAADRTLAADPRPGRAVFLPWHEYMAFSFVGNPNRVVGNPAQFFFSLPVTASQDPEVPGVLPPTDNVDQLAITNLVRAGRDGPWAPVLAAHDFKYLIVARELDWSAYDYLSTQPGLQLVADYGSIILYRNSLWNVGG